MNSTAASGPVADSSKSQFLCTADSFWRKNTGNVFHLQKCQIINYTIYNKIIHYCRMTPKFSVTDKLEIFVQHSKNSARNSQTAKLKYLQLSSFKMPNMTHLAF